MTVALIVCSQCQPGTVRFGNTRGNDVAQRLRLNADSWLDVRKAYLKLREPEHYEQLKHGFARGDETAQFVENIRNYTDILTRLEKPLDLDIRYDLQLDDTTLSMGAPKRVQPASNVSTSK